MQLDVIPPNIYCLLSVWGPLQAVHLAPAHFQETEQGQIALTEISPHEGLDQHGKVRSLEHPPATWMTLRISITLKKDMLPKTVALPNDPQEDNHLKINK